MKKEELDSIAQTTIQEIEKSFTQIEVTKVLQKIAAKFGFKYFTFARVFPKAITRLELNTIGNYPDEWMSEYQENNYVFVDPVIKHCLSHRTPYDWKNIFIDKNEEVIAFGEACSKYELTEGFSIGVNGNCGDFSMLSFGSNRQFDVASHLGQKVIYIAHIILPYLHEKLLQIYPVSSLYPTNDLKEQNIPLQELTVRESECLLWSAEGKTAMEISMILDISESTVNFHLKNAVIKLDSANKTHAVAKAILLGLIKCKVNQ